MTYPCKTEAEAQHLVRVLEQAGYTATLTVTAQKITVTSAVSGKPWREILSRFRRQQKLREVADRYTEKLKTGELKW